MMLCNECSKLDLFNYRVRKRPYDVDYLLKGRDAVREYMVDNVPNEYDVGDYTEIDNRHATSKEYGAQQASIPSIDLVREELKQQQTRTASDIIGSRDACQLCSVFTHHMEKNQVGLDAVIRIYPATFCFTTDKKNTERQTVRLEVFEVVETAETMIGPLEAFQIAKLVGNETRCILELQECCSSIPSTLDDDPHVRKDSSVDTDTRFSGRIIGPKANLKLFSRWIKLCNALHGERCGQPILPVSRTRLLKSLLVIDVDLMCIIDAPALCRYAALSYCWGRAPMAKHMLGNSTLLRQPGALSDLHMPATIADAIELVRGVGEKFLWVDALCIIQDDPVSKTAQLAQMGLIYSHAAFTIVAASGNNADAGLPGVRADSREVDQKFVRVGETSLLGVVGGHGYYSGVQRSDWITRGWTMQEKILSKKLLIFTDQQVYWSCWNAVWLEEVVLENVFNISFQHNPVEVGPADVGFSSIEKSSDIYHLYEMLVNAYRERQLTFQSDILNAFSGLCQALSAISNESFHWGIPLTILDQGLCWYLRGGGTRNYARCDPDGANPLTPSVPFPSWSWAAWHGTSKDSWIHWRSLSPNQVTSGIMFSCYDYQGRHRQLSQDPLTASEREVNITTGCQRRESIHISRPWMGQPRVTDPKAQKAQINSGLLHFWTSTATLCIRRRRNPNPLGTPIMLHDIIEFGDDGALLNMDAWAHPHSLNDKESKSSVDVYNNLGSSLERGDMILEREFVVIHSGSQIAALAVEWKDGVAYRIGIVFVSEQKWSRLQNRVWKQVILG